MSNISKITNNANSVFLNSKRNFTDGTEMYIRSKIDMLYRNAVSGNSIFSNRNSLKKIAEGTYLNKNV